MITLTDVAHALQTARIVLLRPNRYRTQPLVRVAAMLPGIAGHPEWVAFGDSKAAATRALAAKLLSSPPERRIASKELADGLGVTVERVKDMALRGQLVEDGSIRQARAWTAASVWAVVEKRGAQYAHHRFREV